MSIVMLVKLRGRRLKDKLYRCTFALLCVWPPGEMASRLTTNQEIAGSTPAVVIFVHSISHSQDSPTLSAQGDSYRLKPESPSSFPSTNH